MRRRRQQAEHHRSGSITLEFIIAFPLLFIAALGVVEFFFVSLVVEAGATALQEGTREAAEYYPESFPLDQAGADNDISDRVVRVINEHLNVHNVEIVDSVNGLAADDPTKQNAMVVIERNGSIVTRPPGGAINQLGEVISCSRTGSSASSDEVVVSLCFELVDAADPDGYDGPVPDWLATFGFTLDGTKFEMSSRASLE